MSKTSMRSVRLTKTAPIFDKHLIVPILAIAYYLVIGPLLEFEHPEMISAANQMFWPPVTAIALGCFASRIQSRLIWPPHIIWLAAYCALAGIQHPMGFKSWDFID